MVTQSARDEGEGMPKVSLALVIGNDEVDRQTIIASALKCGLSPICCSNFKNARTMLSQDEFRMVLCSETLEDGDFQAVLREAHKSDVRTPVIVFGRSYDWDSYLKALGAGAYDYIVCPPNPLEVERIIWLALADTIGSEKSAHVPA